jgi:hypothetical protein
MFPFFNRHASSHAASAQPAVNSLTLQSIPADTPQENDASGEERPATYEELMPYLMLAMVAAR